MLLPPLSHWLPQQPPDLATPAMSRVAEENWSRWKQRIQYLPCLPLRSPANTAEADCVEASDPFDAPACFSLRYYSFISCLLSLATTSM
ncbi:hypothetical protein M407DRAFT_241227, partial [Tulasnella calospora MUT 4182]